LTYIFVKSLFSSGKRRRGVGFNYEVVSGGSYVEKSAGLLKRKKKVMIEKR